MNRLILAALAVAGLILPAVRAEDKKFEGPTSGTIKIVSSLPRTGSAKGQTDTIVNGIKLALEEEGNKVGDFKIVYEDLDDATAAAGQWDAQKETSNANQARDDADVMVYIGTYNSGAAKISMPILNKAGILMVSPANTSPSLTKPNFGEKDEPTRYRPSGKVNYFRVVPTDDVQGPVAAHWAKSMKIKSVYVLDDNEVYGKGIADLFRGECEGLKLKVLGQESIDVKAQEFKALMQKIKALKPGLIYFGGTTQTKAGQLAKDMVAAGITAPLMVPDGCYEQSMIESAGADVLNGRCYVTFGGLPPTELAKKGGKGKAFVDAYEKKFGKIPDEAYAVYGYECAKVALEAIRKAGVKNREAIVAAAGKLKKFEGALGTWSFDVNGDTDLKMMSGSKVVDGKFVFEKILEIKD
ncbi:branched-chain amino acid ABC transporter substrate-binding protein [Zavarzinella formosa]|uniref:branched-chain amino acid ABC transporter substrate-binding protein n=1 Tax=Zavarzinella formosa TaxID=360055 RepID=UPI0003117653|nr:branched-chain amino acid ABC transporter substrate-binding protein [Zavarzinella formosa]